jgi:TolA-binding protein
MWQSNFKEEGMRALVAYLLALGLVVMPAMAATGSAGDKDNTAAKSSGTAASDNSTATDKDKDASSTASKSESKSDPATPGKTAASSSLESELQQLRDLLETQSKQIQIQNEQMREQQERMEAMEAELKVATTPRDTSYAPAPDSRVPKTADGSAPAPNPRMADFSIGTVDGQAADAENNPIAIRYKGITLTPGGFLAAETVFRNKADDADINTAFNQIPLPGNSGSQTTEFNATARQSRISLLAEGKLTSVKLSGYVETDFLGTGIASNENQSNSYVLRLRQGWGQAKFDNGFTVTGGQMWSLVTETKKGVENRQEALPLVIDPQYNVGFSWARQYGFRVSKSFGDKLTLAASVEEAATTLTVHGNPTSTIPASTNVTVNGVTVPTLSTTVFNNFLVGAPGIVQGQFNPVGTYAYDKTPDFVFKAALDPGWGHYEVFGIVSTFRDRVYPCFAANGAITLTLAGEGTTPFPTVAIPANPCALTGSTNPASGAFNSSSVGGGIGANARAPLGKHLDVGIHVLGGNGIGRYGSAGLADTTARPDGTLALLRGYQALGTLEFHATPQLDIYAYVGGEYAGRWMDGKEGYGSNLRRNDGCAVQSLPIAAPGAAINTTAVLGSNGFIPDALSNCDGDTRAIFEGTIGFWYRFYNGPKGRFQWGPQYSYVSRNTWSGVNATGGGVGPHGIDNMVFTSFRYYLP